jgi:glycosyltransferase involved in cell wall biosynthesis
MVLYQALAMEVVPVIAKVGGCGELVTPECGFLVHPPERTAGYVEAITALAADGRRRREMARAGRKRMQTFFALAELDREYRNLYQALLS